MNKKAERSFFPGTTAPAPSTKRSAPAPTQGALHGLTPQQKEIEAAADAAFRKALVDGALKGDSWRGLIRGGMKATADSIDFFYDAPVRTLFAPQILLGKLYKAKTGDDSYERGARQVRDKIVAANVLPHLISKAYRGLADTSLLDPKHLEPEDFKLAEASGYGGAVAAEAILEMATPAAAQRVLAVAQLPDIITTNGKPVFEALNEAAKENAQSGRNKNIPMLHPIRKPSLMLDADKLVERNQDKKKQRLRRFLAESLIEKEQTEEQNKNKRFDQSLAAGVGGFLGLVGAHQITKRIPALKKKRILRYLINAAAAGGAGYAAWKWMGK